jgi:hypothetical protein
MALPRCALASVFVLVFLGCKPEPKPVASGESSANPAASGAAAAPAGDKTAPAPGLPALPSLGDISVYQFIRLPGVDVPNEPPLATPGQPINATETERLNSLPEVLQQLKDREQMYATADGKCQVWMPGAVILSLPLIVEEQGWVNRSYLIRTPDQSAEFRFREMTIQAGEPDQARVKQWLDATAKDSLRREGAKLLHRCDVSKSGLTGEEAMIEKEPGKTVEIIRVYCVNAVVYILTETNGPREGLTPLGQKYFDSFQRR